MYGVKFRLTDRLSCVLFCENFRLLVGFMALLKNQIYFNNPLKYSIFAIILCKKLCPMIMMKTIITFAISMTISAVCFADGRVVLAEEFVNTLDSIPPIEMVFVEGGTFQMGATSEQESEANKDEKPVHTVTVSSFYIGKTEVTQELWMAVMGGNPSYFNKGGNYPVENVTWFEIQEFLLRLYFNTGKNYRLPTEAEWEYAARGGNKSRGYKYCGGNNIGDIAWYEDNSSGGTHPVATKSPNELGIYDMSGNVCEWCQDLYGDYLSSSQIKPQDMTFLVLRGGSWSYGASDCRVSSRDFCSLGFWDKEGGFRLVLVH